MKLEFYKYHGTGNDFIIIDNRTKTFPKEDAVIKTLCMCHFGIGADGLILLEEDRDTDFKMVYYNSDGKESTMCGNGGRCLVAFAHQLGLFDTKAHFMAIDGVHHASINNNMVSLQMIDVAHIEIKKDHLFIDTGSPHHVQLSNDLDQFDVFTEGRKIRNQLYGSEGSNINFVEQVNKSTFRVRTYERGVEDETLACGTGATAVAIGMHAIKKTSLNEITLLVKGGKLVVSFQEFNKVYNKVFLSGPAQLVFSGSVHL